MPKKHLEWIMCDMCHEDLITGDEYYLLDDVPLCPDCWDKFSESLKRVVGDVVDLC